MKDPKISESFRKYCDKYHQIQQNIKVKFTLYEKVGSEGGGGLPSVS